MVVKGKVGKNRKKNYHFVKNTGFRREGIMAVMSLKQVKDEGGTCKRILSLSKVHFRLLHGDFSQHACVFTFLYSVK